MDIFDFALKMEKDGEKYYRELSEKTDVEGLKTILTMLADAEVKHVRMIEQMRTDAKGVRMAEDALFEDTKNIFQQMKASKPVFDFDATHADFYRKALDIEAKSHAFYKEQADKSGDDEKRLFLQLAEEEKRHMILMENLTEFVSRPESWLENAEWYHLDEY